MNEKNSENRKIQNKFIIKNELYKNSPYKNIFFNPLFINDSLSRVKNDLLLQEDKLKEYKHKKAKLNEFTKKIPFYISPLNQNNTLNLLPKPK